MGLPVPGARRRDLGQRVSSLLLACSVPGRSLDRLLRTSCFPRTSHILSAFRRESHNEGFRALVVVFPGFDGGAEWGGRPAIVGLMVEQTPERAHANRMRRSQQLEAIGYLDGSVPPAREGTVVTYDAARAYNGLNFFSSGHAPEALLMDMDGNVLHRWRYAFDDVWPDDPVDRAVRVQ